MATFRILSSGAQWYFHLRGNNNEIVLTSEMYTTKENAGGGVASVKVNAPLDTRYDRRTSQRNEPYFVLKAVNGEIIGRSEMYSAAAARDNGIAWVKANAPTAQVG